MLCNMSLHYKFTAETLISQHRTTLHAIQEVQTWSKTANLPALQPELVALFLIACRNDIATTQATVAAYFRTKNSGPEIFNDRDIHGAELKRMTQVMACCSLPKRTDDNTAIHFFKMLDTDHRNFDFVTFLKMIMMVFDVSQRQNPPDQFEIVTDLKGVTLMHISRLKISAMRKFFDYLQEGIPAKLRAIHVLNVNFVTEKMLSIVRMLMNSELVQLMKPYPEGFPMKQFHQIAVPAACLPEELDGELPGVRELNLKTIEQFSELREFFECEEQLRNSHKSE